MKTSILVIPGSRCQLPSEYFVIFALLRSNWPSIGRLELKNQVSLVSCRINFRYAKLILVYPRYASRSKLFSKYIIDKDIDNTAIDIIYHNICRCISVSASCNHLTSKTDAFNIYVCILF